jgi:RNA polymerase sigma factor (TIGR02999 family)
MGEITVLIRAASEGDERAADQLYERLYADLRRLARARLRAGGRDAILDTSVVVHEAYVRLVRAGSVKAADRGQFLAYAARAIRSVVVDFVRERNADRRGGGATAASLSDGVMAPKRDDHEILRVHEALNRLGRLDAALARLVEMRYFAGFDVREIADVLGVSERTVERQWQKARAFLFEALK